MRKRLILLLVLIFLTSNAFADEKRYNILKEVLETAISPIDTILGPVVELGQIIVTPSRVKERLSSSSVSVSVINNSDIDRKKIDTVKEALKDEVGIDIRQAGAFQGQTSLFMRGGNSNHTLLLVDGVKLYDPVSTGGQYNFAHLTVDNIGRIEVVRGPQSALYGSDAMAGIINITSKKAEDTYVNASFDGGSFYTFKEQFEAGSASHGFHYSIAGSRLDTKGISQAQAKKNNQERDPYDRTSLALRADYDFGDKGSIGGTWRYLDANFALDQGANTDDDNAFSTSRENLFTLFGNYELFKWWGQAITLGWMENMRINSDDDSPLTFDFNRDKYYGRYFRLDYQNIFTIMEIDKVILGYAYSEESGQFYSQNDYSGFMSVAAMSKVIAKENDFYLENRINFNDRLTSTQGMRVTDHSTAGTHVTYRLDGSYLIATGTKIRGLFATGFRAPSLYQLYAPSDAFFGGGNQNLKPETSQSYEYGLDQYLFGEKAILGITYFHAIYKDIIDALTNPDTFITNAYTNIGKMKVHGIEASLKLTPVKALILKGGITFQDAWDVTNDQEAPRRPGRKFFVEGFWQATDKLGVGLVVRYNGPMSDNLSIPLFALNSYKVKEYVVVNMTANYDVTKNLSVYTKMENLFNKDYEDVRGFTMPPFSVYGGVKAKF